MVTALNCLASSINSFSMIRLYIVCNYKVKLYNYTNLTSVENNLMVLLDLRYSDESGTSRDY